MMPSSTASLFIVILAYNATSTNNTTAQHGNIHQLVTLVAPKENTEALLLTASPIPSSPPAATQ
jgi:hypothetical protein